MHREYVHAHTRMGRVLCKTTCARAPLQGGARFATIYAQPHNAWPNCEYRLAKHVHIAVQNSALCMAWMQGRRSGSGRGAVGGKRTQGQADTSKQSHTRMHTQGMHACMVACSVGQGKLRHGQGGRQREGTAPKTRTTAAQAVMKPNSTPHARLSAGGEG